MAVQTNAAVFVGGNFIKLGLYLIVKHGNLVLEVETHFITTKGRQLGREFHQFHQTQ